MTADHFTESGWEAERDEAEWFERVEAEARRDRGREKPRLDDDHHPPGPDEVDQHTRWTS